MKTTHRTFVVEYKKNKRAPRANAGSIWGGTDLKELAREIASETENAHPVALINGPGAFEQNRSLAPLTADPGSAEKSRLEDADDAFLPQSSGTEVRLSSEVGLVSSSEAQPTQTNSPPAQRRTRSQANPTRRTSRSALETLATSAQPKHREDLGLAQEIVSDEELAALDFENGRLRRQLAEKLRADNEILKRMLRRFGLS